MRLSSKQGARHKGGTSSERGQDFLDTIVGSSSLVPALPGLCVRRCLRQPSDVSLIWVVIPLSEITMCPFWERSSAGLVASPSEKHGVMLMIDVETPFVVCVVLLGVCGFDHFL